MRLMKVLIFRVNLPRLCLLTWLQVAVCLEGLWGNQELVGILFPMFEQNVGTCA